MSRSEKEKDPSDDIDGILSDVDRLLSDAPPSGQAAEPAKAPASKPAPAKPPVPVSIDWATKAPEDVPADRVRHVGISYCPESAGKVAAFVKFMQSLAQKSSQNPIFPIPSFVDLADIEDFPPGLRRAREMNVDALIVIVPTAAERRDFAYVLPESHPVSRVFTLDELERRMLVVDLIVDMMMVQK
jgi:hypothetical protein